MDQVKGRIGSIKSGKRQIMPVFQNAGEEPAAAEAVAKANKKEKFKK